MFLTEHGTHEAQHLTCFLRKHVNESSIVAVAAAVVVAAAAVVECSDIQTFKPKRWPIVCLS